jgi:hypothetical protein
MNGSSLITGAPPVKPSSSVPQPPPPLTKEAKNTQERASVDACANVHTPAPTRAHASIVRRDHHESHSSPARLAFLADLAAHRATNASSASTPAFIPAFTPPRPFNPPSSPTASFSPSSFLYTILEAQEPPTPPRLSPPFTPSLPASSPTIGIQSVEELSTNPSLSLPVPSQLLRRLSAEELSPTLDSSPPASSRVIRQLSAEQLALRYRPSLYPSFSSSPRRISRIPSSILSTRTSSQSSSTSLQPYSGFNSLQHNSTKPLVPSPLVSCPPHDPCDWKHHLTSRINPPSVN